MSDDKDKKGLFIVFEGIDGSGKSTQVARFCSYLKRCKVDHISTREPGGTELSEKIRDIVKYNSTTEHISPEVEVLLFNAARCCLIDNLILPNINKGTTVVCDRYYPSTIAYQSGGRELPYKETLEICNYATQHIREPDILFFLDIPYEVHKERKAKQSDSTFSFKNTKSKIDRLELSDPDYYKRIINTYHKLLNEIHDTTNTTIVRIDGTKKESEVLADIILAYMSYMTNSLFTSNIATKVPMAMEVAMAKLRYAISHIPYEHEVRKSEGFIEVCVHGVPTEHETEIFNTIYDIGLKLFANTEFLVQPIVLNSKKE